MTPAAKFAVLTDELRETREAAAMLVSQLAMATAKTPEDRAAVAAAYDSIANGQLCSRVTEVLCRLVAERLRAE